MVYPAAFRSALVWRLRVPDHMLTIATATSAKTAITYSFFIAYRPWIVCNTRPTAIIIRPPAAIVIRKRLAFGLLMNRKPAFLNFVPKIAGTMCFRPG